MKRDRKRYAVAEAAHREAFPEGFDDPVLDGVLGHDDKDLKILLSMPKKPKMLLH